MVTKLEALLLEAAGLQSIAVNGTTTTFTDLTKQHEFWKSKVAREQGLKPRLTRIDLSGF